MRLTTAVFEKVTNNFIDRFRKKNLHHVTKCVYDGEEL